MTTPCAGYEAYQIYQCLTIGGGSGSMPAENKQYLRIASGGFANQRGIKFSNAYITAVLCCRGACSIIYQYNQWKAVIVMLVLMYDSFR